jgi:hypothetical protein
MFIQRLINEAEGNSVVIRYYDNKFIVKDDAKNISNTMNFAELLDATKKNKNNSMVKF